MYITEIMGAVIRLAGLLSPAHARAVSDFMLDNVVGMATDAERDAACVRMIAAITSEMIGGPIYAAEQFGCVALIVPVLPDDEELAERDQTFGSIRYDGEKFGLPPSDL